MIDTIVDGLVQQVELDELELGEYLEGLRHVESYYDQRCKYYITVYSDSLGDTAKAGDTVVLVKHLAPSSGFLSATLIQ